MFHPDIYTPAPTLGDKSPPPPSGRPYDREMWAQPGSMDTMSDDEVRDSYDRAFNREDEEPWDEFLQSRYTS